MADEYWQPVKKVKGKKCGKKKICVGGDRAHQAMRKIKDNDESAENAQNIRMKLADMCR